MSSSGDASGAADAARAAALDDDDDDEDDAGAGGAFEEDDRATDDVDASPGPSDLDANPRRADARVQLDARAAARRSIAPANVAPRTAVSCRARAI
jgi:hypothetical protein